MIDVGDPQKFIVTEEISGWLVLTSESMTLAGTSYNDYPSLTAIRLCLIG